jgi:CubicO group peptidase (beta-lactamase class C family)
MINRRLALKRIVVGTGCAAESLLANSAIVGSAFPDASPKDSERKVMASVAEDFKREFNIPALSVAVAYKGRLLYESALGVADRGARVPLDASHLFRIASVSKPITSSAIFRLVEKGLLRTDDTVFGRNSILGTKFGTFPYREDIQEITVDQLLTHTCGGWDNGPDDPMFANLAMDQAELISWTLDNQPLKHRPGTVFAYSNFGYCILGRVIERLSGQPYSEFVRNAILAPCGIADMLIGGNTLSDRAAQEVTYYGQNGENPYGMNITRMDSHGGWLATARDLVRFAIHVDGLDVKRNILRRETIERMTTPSAVHPNYARGWSVNEKGNWWHIGSLPGTTTILVRTSSKFCWAALTNTRREPEGEMDRALDNMMWDMVSRVSEWQALLGIM